MGAAETNKFERVLKCARQIARVPHRHTHPRGSLCKRTPCPAAARRLLCTTHTHTHTHTHTPHTHTHRGPQSIRGAGINIVHAGERKGGVCEAQEPLPFNQHLLSRSLSLSHPSLLIYTCVRVCVCANVTSTGRQITCSSGIPFF